MSDGDPRLSALEALSARIDRAEAQGDQSAVQDLTAQMMQLVGSSLAPTQRSEIPLPGPFIDLAAAIAMGDLGAVAQIAPTLDLNHPIGPDGRFPLIWALTANDRRPEMVALLLMMGAGAQCATQDGFTALHFVANAPTPDAEVEIPTEIVRLLVAAGADLEARHHWGWTPLHCAVMEGRTRELEALLRNGADPNARFTLRPGLGGDPALTPLMIAGAETDKVALLLHYGADPGLRNGAGQSAAAYLRAEANTSEASLAAKRATQADTRFDRDYARGLRRSALLVAGPQAVRH